MKKNKKQNTVVTPSDSVVIPSGVEESLKNEVLSLNEKLARTLADYQNQEKRHQSQRSQIVKLANESLIYQLLPILDDLERAQTHLKDQGLGHVIKQFFKTLDNEGVKVVDPIGFDFDPLTMDCAEAVDGPKNKVVKTVLKGYTYADKTLRPAKVEVGNGTTPSVIPDPSVIPAEAGIH